MFRYSIPLFLVLIVCSLDCFAQRKPIQWTGVIRNEELEPLPFASVSNTSNGRGAISDKNGLFSIVLFSTDSLMVSYVGYKTLVLPIPKSNSDIIMYDVIMETDTIALREVLVLPWHTFDEFVDEFVHTALATDKVQRAYKNLILINRQVQRRLIEDFNQPSDPNMSFRISMAEQQAAMAQEGSILPTYRITNPLAWAELVQAIKRGDFKNEE